MPIQSISASFCCHFMFEELFFLCFLFFFYFTFIQGKNLNHIWYIWNIWSFGKREVACYLCTKSAKSAHNTITRHLFEQLTDAMYSPQHLWCDLFFQTEVVLPFFIRKKQPKHSRWQRWFSTFLNNVCALVCVWQRLEFIVIIVWELSVNWDNLQKWV